ncbi:TetR/AcrR family transcriptional regulator [Tahibacter caeni]|uniref:TetR/AcrR family transcriptional regulator n=1 Tax=Tahibacter caeni TaxID=1453545 RepID=UPI002147B371
MTRPTRSSKKAAVRQALVAAANRRFHRQGFEQTTIDEICADAGVSRRTFFRYFENKEALAFPHRAERLERFLALLDGAGHSPNPVDGLRAICETFAHEYSANREQLLAQQRLVDSVPALAAREHEIDRDWEAAMAATFRRRFGRGAAAERRARLMAGAAIGVIRATMRYWYEKDGKPDLARLGQEALDRLEQGFLC